MGDIVWSKNPETGEQAYKPVTELIRKHERQIYYLVVNTQLGESLEIGTTDDHPFYVPGVGWKSTVELTVGTLIETDGYGLVSVGSIRTYGDVQPTYNFSVADFHTYYVTERNLLVHNENCDLDGGKGGSKSIQEQAQEVKHKLNGDKNTVTVRSGNKETQFDLDGPAHKGVETPHKQFSHPHTNPKGNTFFNKDRKTVEPMTQQDIRTVRSILERRNRQ